MTFEIVVRIGCFKIAREYGLLVDGSPVFEPEFAVREVVPGGR